MDKKTNIFIIGPMGAGKSTIGLQIARKLKREFHDTDRVLEERMGVDVSWLFDVEGEEGFRKRETKLLKELALLNDVVISTGGEIILLPENREILQTHGHVIHLTTDLKKQIERTARNKYKRPTLRGDDSKERIKCFSQEREPLYEEIAEVTFLSNSRNVSQIVKKVLAHIKKAGW